MLEIFGVELELARLRKAVKVREDKCERTLSWEGEFCLLVLFNFFLELNLTSIAGGEGRAEVGAGRGKKGKKGRRKQRKNGRMEGKGKKEGAGS